MPETLHQGQSRMSSTVVGSKSTASLNSTGSTLSARSSHDLSVGDEHGVYSIAINSQGSIAAIGLGNGGLQIFSLELYERIRKRSQTGLPLMAMKFYPCLTRNTMYTAGSDGVVTVWNMEDNKVSLEMSVSEARNEISALDICNDGTHFVTAGKDKNVRLYDSERLTITRQFLGTDAIELESDEAVNAELGHSKKIFALKFHPDDKHVFLTASWDHSVKIWDTRSTGAARTIHGPFVCGDGLDISQKTILTASWISVGALQTWDYGSSRLLQTFPLPASDRSGEFLYCARFWDTQSVVSGGSGSTDVNIQDLNTGEIVEAIPGDGYPVQALEVKESKGILLLGSSHNLLRAAEISEILPP